MGLLYASLSEIKLTDVFFALSSIICLYLIHFYYKHYTRINPLPGPIPIPLIGSFALVKKDLDIDAFYYNLSKKYGGEGIYEVAIGGKRQILFTRADYIETFFLSSINVANHAIRTEKDVLLDLFDLDRKGIALNFDHHNWKFNREMFTQAIMPLTFSPKPSKYVNALFEEMSNCWMDLKPKGDAAGVINIASWLRRFTTDFIHILVTEKRGFAIHYYHRKFKNEITKEMIESEEFIECVDTFVSDNIPYVPHILKDFPFIRPRVQKLIRNNDRFYIKLEDIIKKRRREIEKNFNSNDNSKPKQLDLLTSMIIVNTPYDTRPPQSNVDPSLLRPMTDNEIRGVLFDCFVAGTDTKLLDEIESVFNGDRTRPITLTDVGKLKYCEALIKETTRIRPTVGMISRYYDRPMEVAGYKWPKNTLFVTFQIASDLVKHANLADGVINPEDVEAKTMVALSPKSIKKYEFQEFDKIIVKRFYIGPWSLNESLICKKYVFSRVPVIIMLELYSKTGGVPKYVLQKIEEAMKYYDPKTLKDDEDDADKDGVDKHTAIIRKYKIKHQSRVEYILTPEEFSDHNEGNKVILPSKSNFGAADLFVTPDNIFQITVPKKHPIKQENNIPSKNISKWCRPSKNSHHNLVSA
ncbi:19026_t:CDS:2 [Entrophospora sp. SA101]|nr:19026_t:CDS:2 [Entrophospora sp. SA101]